MLDTRAAEALGYRPVGDYAAFAGWFDYAAEDAYAHRDDPVLTMPHTRVPRNALDRLPRRIWDARQALADVRRRARLRPGGLSGDVGRALAAWAESADASRLRDEHVRPVFGGADGNIANFVWNGTGYAVVDFEDSGTSDRAFEVADLVEHVSGWLTGAVDADVLLRHLALDRHEQRRLLPARRRPRDGAHRRGGGVAARRDGVIPPARQPALTGRSSGVRSTTVDRVPTIPGMERIRSRASARSVVEPTRTFTR